MQQAIFQGLRQSELLQQINYRGQLVQVLYIGFGNIDALEHRWTSYVPAQGLG